MEVITNTQIEELHLAEETLTRDIYDLTEDTQLVVHKDQMSVNDIPLDAAIPYKGVFTNQVSIAWLNRFTHLTRSPLIAYTPAKYPEMLQPYAAMLEGRSAIVKKIRPLPMRFVVRGYISGAQWQEYKETKLVSGHSLRRGTKEAQRLDGPLLIPTSNFEPGKQIEGDAKQWCIRMLGQKIYSSVEDICLSIYGVARNYSAARGLILADTEFVFGMYEGDVYLISDLLSPELSTYWPGDDSYVVGQPQPNFIKQELFQWLRSEAWDGESTPPSLPSEMAKKIARKYRTVYDVMLGKIPPIKKEEENTEGE